MLSPHWKSVEYFSVSAPAKDPLAAVEALVPGAAQRYAADDGSRAILVPFESLASALVSSPGVPASAQVVFVDPPAASTVLSALAEEVLPLSVWIALPEGAGGPGLVEQPGRLSLDALDAGTSKATAYVFFRPADSRRESSHRLAAAPKIGESADVLDERSKWFEAREGKQS